LAPYDIYIHPHPALSPQGRGKKEMTVNKAI